MKEKSTCFKCKKNVNLYGITCKCKQIFCYLCLDAAKHNCNFDYINENKINLEKINKKIIPDKLEKI